MKKAEEYLRKIEIEDNNLYIDILKAVKQAQIDAINEFFTRLVEDDKAAEYFTQDDDPDYMEVMYYSSAIHDLHKQLRKEME